MMEYFSEKLLLLFLFYYMANLSNKCSYFIFIKLFFKKNSVLRALHAIRKN